MKITPNETLIYCDFPQLFIGSDEYGNRFICMAIDSDSNYQQWCCLKVNQVIYGQLKDDIDCLRTAIIKNKDRVYLATAEHSEIKIEQFLGVIEEKYLPASGLFLGNYLKPLTAS